MKHLETSATAALDLKAVSDTGEFEGYASRFNEVDLGNDSVQPGAFAKSLKARPAAKVKLLRQHDQSEPIGVFTDIAEDSVGLFVKGRLILDTARGRETHALMRAGALDTFSIGYKAKSPRMVKGVRLLDEVDLYEISIVTFGMLPSATVSSVKSSNNSFSALVEAINAGRAHFKD